jgi:hypothetical protein
VDQIADSDMIRDVPLRPLIEDRYGVVVRIINPLIAILYLVVGGESDFRSLTDLGAADHLAEDLKFSDVSHSLSPEDGAETPLR